MTLAQFLRLVLLLGKQVHVRYFLHWNYPHTPQVMALHICDYWQAVLVREWTNLFTELEKMGFEQCVRENGTFWLIERKD